MLIDLDHFKTVNDSWGHAAGDAVLIAFSRALRDRSRAGDHFARVVGGARQQPGPRRDPRGDDSTVLAEFTLWLRDLLEPRRAPPETIKVSYEVIAEVLGSVAVR